MSDTFDPSKHLTPARKNGPPDYLQVKWRLVWLRSEHPEATTSTEHVEISPDIAIFKATVSIPGGGSATDYGSETPRDFGDYIEKASTKALGRALAQLGYGTQFVGEDMDDAPRALGGDERKNNPRIVDSPVNRKDYGVVAYEPANQPARQSRTPPSSAVPLPAARGTAAGPPPPEETEYPPLNDAQLLELIRDDTLGPDERWNALWDYFDRAETLADLTARETAVLTSGMPGRDIKAAHRTKRNSLGAKPLSVAG